MSKPTLTQRLTRIIEKAPKTKTYSYEELVNQVRCDTQLPAKSVEAALDLLLHNGILVRRKKDASIQTNPRLASISTRIPERKRKAH